ncbi:uncharacterized protein [Palaemon carinicauda]|uniref:uncharacterized protein n=1 Tax=Palaemon carinicauda TaxID=392227 RepID=UPI0035B60388
MARRARRLDWSSHPLSVKLSLLTETLTVNNRTAFNIDDTGTPQRITDWKRPLRIATWNVRTLYKTGAAKVLEHELDKNKIDIAALQEIRWTEIGKLEQEKGVILYSRRDDGYPVEGAGFYLIKRAHGALMEFTPISSRIAKIRLKAKWFHIMILCLHALTEITDDDEKDEWYDHVQTEIDQIPRHNVLLILGDMNAKIGKEFDTRAFRGAYCDSDHMLVVGKLRVKLKSKRLTTIKTITPNIEKLKETDVRNAYAINVQNRFGLLEEEEITSDWETIKSVVTGAAMESLGPCINPRRRNNWFDEECRSAAERRKRCRMKWIEDIMCPRAT